MMQQETIVVSVGGSLIVPDTINTTFLKKLNTFIRSQIETGKHFIIIAGGGKTCRRYQDAARKVVTLQNEDLDWLGIHATRLNGHLLRSIFHDIAYPTLLKSPNKKLSKEHPVHIAAGWKPGWSTDYVAVRIAKKIGAKKLINLSNIDNVFDKDPKKYKDAKKIKDINWSDFRALLPEEWDPGLSSPFDPIAARDAEKLKMEVAVINGTKLKQMEKYLKGEKFVGTLIL